MKMTRRASGLSVTTSAQAQNVIQMISTELPILLKIGNSKEIRVSIYGLYEYRGKRVVLFTCKGWLTQSWSQNI